MPFATTRTEIPGWATSLEAVSEFPLEGERTFEIHLEDPPEFIIAAVSLPNGQRPPWIDAQLSIAALQPQSEQFIAIGEGVQDSEDVFVDERRSLFIFNRPESRDWRITLSATSIPVALNIMAFHPNLRTRVKRIRLALRHGPFKCSACKTTAKALALAIVAAATLPHLPAALIAAVASFLGMLKAAAAVFITTVIGDTVRAITEKLCRMIGMCP